MSTPRNRMAVAACVAVLAIGGVSAAPAPDPVDALEWLEPPQDARALDWARARTAESMAALRKGETYDAVRKDLATLLGDGGTQPDVVLAGPRALRVFKDAAHPYGQLQVATRGPDGTLGAWEVALDIGDLRRREGVPYLLQTYTLATDCVAPEALRCLLRLAPEGGDEVELREYDLARKAFIDDGFRVPRARVAAAWIDRDTVAIGHTVGNAPKTAAGWPARIQLWTRGQPLAAAKTVFEAKPTDALVSLATLGEGDARRLVISRALDFSTFEIALATRDGAIERLPFPEKVAPMGVQATTRDHVVVKLVAPLSLEGRDYPAGALVAWSATAPAGRRASLVYAPAEGESVLRGAIAATDGSVAFVTTRRLVQQVRQAFPQGAGWRTTTLADVPSGEVASLVQSSGIGDRVVVATTGFATPRRQEIVGGGAKPVLLAADRDLVAPGSYTTEIGTATSRDGTEVDYYLLKPVKSPWEGPQPLLVTGYAAFGISSEPSYLGYSVGGLSFRAWMARGGSLVIPAARGGGERGDAWHQAAMRERRQNSYDDFLAVLDALVATGYTAPGRIGVFGASNGGLLAATLATQRPALFGAVVSDVPLTDMLRMRHMGMGSAWLNEYGSPDVPAQRAALLAYSPLHNVREGVAYPPFLVTIATSDNRVGPGHARKLAARLRQVGATAWFVEDEEGGHGVSDGYRNPDLMSLRIAFFIDALMTR